MPFSSAQAQFPARGRCPGGPDLGFPCPKARHNCALLFKLICGTLGVSVFYLLVSWGPPWPSLGEYLPLHALCTGFGLPLFSPLLGFLAPWGCSFSPFWSLGGPLGRPWEITCRFTLIAQAWAGRSFHHYSGHGARYANRYQSGLDQYHEARYILSGISLDLLLF